MTSCAFPMCLLFTFGIDKSIFSSYGMQVKNLPHDEQRHANSDEDWALLTGIGIERKLGSWSNR